MHFCCSPYPGNWGNAFFCREVFGRGLSPPPSQKHRRGLRPMRQLAIANEHWRAVKNIAAIWYVASGPRVYMAAIWYVASGPRVLSRFRRILTHAIRICGSLSSTHGQGSSGLRSCLQGGAGMLSRLGGRTRVGSQGNLKHLCSRGAAGSGRGVEHVARKDSQRPRPTA